MRLFSGGSVAFHPKAYIFWSTAGETAAGYVGSSNLSASGIDGGVEWNLGTDRVEQLVAGFESLWTDERSEPPDATSYAVTSADRHPLGEPGCSRRAAGCDACMRIRASLPEADVEFLDDYARSQGRDLGLRWCARRSVCSALPT